MYRSQADQPRNKAGLREPQDTAHPRESVCNVTYFRSRWTFRKKSFLTLVDNKKELEIEKRKKESKPKRSS